MGPSDHQVPGGYARILTERARDARDHIIVQEKLDGSCVAVAKLNGALIALSRKGYRADASPYELHHRFASWVEANHARFDAVLQEGERLVGEWLAQAHGTIYDLRDREPFGAFDLMRGEQRALFGEFLERVDGVFDRPHVLHVGTPISIADAMARHQELRWPCDEVEGVVYRCERDGVVEFLAKYVRADKVDGKYLKGDPIWLWPNTSVDREPK